VATTLRIYAQEWDAARRSGEPRARSDRLYGNAMETTGRSGQKQTDTESRASAADLRVIRDAASQLEAAGQTYKTGALPAELLRPEGRVYWCFQLRNHAAGEEAQ
jgi:hypothetical protein